MHTTDPTLAAPHPRALVLPTLAGARPAYWLLRVGAALCFIGHGAFGFITKAAWLPYFGVVGIPEGWAWQLMPLVGAVDVLAGMAVLFAPRGIALAYMIVWAAWTALLRPLAGESVFETLERAGNYGVPLALFVMLGIRLRWRDLFTRHDAPPRDAHPGLVMTILQWTTVLLLLGHGALGAMTGKPALATHYSAIGLPAATMAYVGWFEIVLAGVVAWRPAVGVLVFIAVWKLATETLFIAIGDPMWEVVERAGSYTAPLALAALSAARSASSRSARSPGWH